MESFLTLSLNTYKFFSMKVAWLTSDRKRASVSFPGLGSATVGIGPAGRKANRLRKKVLPRTETVEALKCSHVSTPFSIKEDRSREQ